MQVDFYQLSRSPVEGALPALAAKVLESGQRLLVVSDDGDQRARISEALWARKGSFLANGPDGDDHADRQPILLSATPEAANGARWIVLADGKWRDEALAFERVFLMFDDTTVEAARAVWRMLDGGEGRTRNYWQQTERGWNKAA